MFKIREDVEWIILADYMILPLIYFRGMFLLVVQFSDQKLIQRQFNYEQNVGND